MSLSIRETPEIALLSMRPGSIWNAKNGLSLLIAARIIIPSHWRTNNPLYLKEWVMELTRL